MTRLVDLPNELLLQISSYLSIHELGCLIRSSDPTYTVLTPALYAHIFRDKPSRVAHANVLEQAVLKGYIRTIKHTFLYGSPRPWQGYKCLVEACAEGNLEIVDFLLSQGVQAEPSESDRQNFHLFSPVASLHPARKTPLYHALACGRRNVAKRLIEAGVDPNKDAIMNFDAVLNDFEGRGSEEMFDLLLQYTFDVHHTDKTHGNLVCWLIERQARVPLSCVQFLPRLLTLGVDVNACNGAHRTPLSLAVVDCPEDIVVALLRHGAWTDIPDRKGNLAIHWAAAEGDESYVSHLVEAGGAPQVNLCNNDGYTPLHLATSRSHKDIRVPVIRDLLHAGADMTVGEQDRPGITILGKMIESEVPTVIRLFLDAGLPLIPAVSPSELLLAAACVGDPFATVQLLDRSDTNIMARTDVGLDPALILAAKNGHDAVVEILMGRMSDEEINIGNIDGTTSLHAAVMSGQESTVRLVAKRSNCFNVADHGNLTPLTVAAIGSEKSICILEYLLANGCNASGTSDPCHLPIRYAVGFGNIEAVHLLLARGAPVNGPVDLDVPVPLEVAVTDGRQDLVNLLLDHGALLEYPEACTTPKTALQIAAKKGDLAMVQLLVKRGASLDTQVPTARDGPPRTVLGIAASRGPPKLDIVRYLLEAGADPNVSPVQKNVPLVVHAVDTEQSDLLNILLETTLARGTRLAPRLDLGAVGRQPAEIALYLATDKRRIDMMEALLRYGADPNYSRPRDGTTPLHVAAMKGNLPAVQLLLSDKRTEVDRADREGRTAFLLATESDRLSTASALVQLGRANTNHRECRGLSALMMAASRCKVEMVKWLLELGVDKNLRDYSGRSALDHATEGPIDEKAKSIVRLLA